MSVQVLHGRDASVTRVSVVEVVQPLALLPVPETAANIHTHTLIYLDLWFDPFYIENHHVWNSQGSCVLWPDAVLVGYGDAGVEGVELHNRRHSRVSVDEYLIIQTGNTCIGVKKCKKGGELLQTGKSQVWFLLECLTKSPWTCESFLPFWLWYVPGL